MTIKEGYNGKDLEIRLSGRPGENIAELWLIQNGVPEEGGAYRYRETLSYISLAEMLELKKEIDEAVKRCFSQNEY